MNRKQILEKLNGKTVKVTYENMFTMDDNEALKQSIIDSLEENGKTIADFEETADCYSVKGFANYWRKSHLIQGENGLFKVRSKDYIFKRERDNQDVYGSIPKADEMIIFENGFKKRVGENQFIIYELV